MHPALPKCLALLYVQYFLSNTTTHSSPPDYQYIHIMLPNPLASISRRAYELAEAHADVIGKLVGVMHASILSGAKSRFSRNMLYAFLFLIAIAGLLFRAIRGVRQSPAASSETTERNNPDKAGSCSHNPSSSKLANRPPGIWIPMEFRRPVATPYPGWDIRKTEPLPYRPFKFGPGHITMGLRAMNWDEWIELDNRYLEWHAIKAKRIQQRGPKCCKTAPEAYDGAIELLEEL